MRVLSACLVSFLCIFGEISGRSTNRHKEPPNPKNCPTALFDSKNISIDFSGGQPDTTSRICGGNCCNDRREEDIKNQAKADIQNSIYHHSRTLQGLLHTTAEVLRESVSTLTRQSKKQTLNLFEQVYQSMAILSRNSVVGLYDTMLDYISLNNTKPLGPNQVVSREVLQLKFIEFFRKLFPIAYHHQVNPQEQDFTQKFKDCLYDSMDEIQPFGDIPKQISASVSKSLEATRVLIQALTLGKSILDKIDRVFFYEGSRQQAACYDGILRMNYCLKCYGYENTIRPCAGLCTNVLRGCLTGPASELDPVWSGYIEAVERLVKAVDDETNPLGLNVEKSVKYLYTRISDAIIYAMQNGPSLKEKVRKICGRFELQPLSKSLSESNMATSILNQNKSDVSIEERLAEIKLPGSLLPSKSSQSPLHSKFELFLTSVEKFKNFYETLADTICEDYPNNNCWNGDMIGEYTKTIVDSSLTAQKYNPEFTSLLSGSSSISFVGNSNTSVLIDQLRHVIQVVHSQLASTPDSSALLADSAVEGSGSGLEPSWNNHRIITDDEDDNHESEGSGSGMGPSTIDPIENTDNEIEVRDDNSAPNISFNMLTFVILFYHLS